MVAVPAAAVASVAVATPPATGTTTKVPPPFNAPTEVAKVTLVVGGGAVTVITSASPICIATAVGLRTGGFAFSTVWLIPKVAVATAGTVIVAAIDVPAPVVAESVTSPVPDSTNVTASPAIGLLPESFTANVTVVNAVGPVSVIALGVAVNVVPITCTGSCVVAVPDVAVIVAVRFALFVVPAEKVKVACPVAFVVTLLSLKMPVFTLRVTVAFATAALPEVSAVIVTVVEPLKELTVIGLAESESMATVDMVGDGVGVPTAASSPLPQPESRAAVANRNVARESLVMCCEYKFCIQSSLSGCAVKIIKTINCCSRQYNNWFINTIA